MSSQVQVWIRLQLKFNSLELDSEVVRLETIEFHDKQKLSVLLGSCRSQKGFLPSTLKNDVAQIAAVLCPLDSGYCGGFRFTRRLQRGAQVQKGGDIVIVQSRNLVFLIARTYKLVIILYFFLNDYIIITFGRCLRH